MFFDKYVLLCIVLLYVYVYVYCLIEIFTKLHLIRNIFIES